MKVLMIGAGAKPSSFIERQIRFLKDEGVGVSVFPEHTSHQFLRTNLCKVGFTFHLPGAARASIAEADLFHYQWPGHLIAYGCFATRFKKPMVISLRGRQINIVPFMPGQNAYVRKLQEWLPRCHSYHCVSEAILKEAEPFGLVPSRAKVIRPAIDPTYFTPVNTRSDAPPVQIAMVGALIWRKGYEYALMAFQRMLNHFPDANLVVVGDGEDQQRIFHAAKDLGVADKLNLRGRLDVEGVRRVLGESHIFLHASLSEGIANVTLEAMSCGLPVVSTNCGGMREAIDDGVNGFLVPLRDTAAMAERIEALARTPELRQRMGQAARDRIVRDFDLKDQGRRFVELYREVLNRHANRTS